MRSYLIVLLLLTGCATSNQPAEWWLQITPAQWEYAKVHGAKLNYRDGRASYIVHPAIVRNILTAKDRLEAQSGTLVNVGFVDSPTPNAFAMRHNGSPIIVFSLPYIKLVGRDEDAIATTMGHEIAHIYLGHGAERQQREENVTAGQAVGTVMNMVVPFSGTALSLGVTAYNRSFTRDEERGADSLGLKWAVAAGYDACGHARVVQAVQPLGNIPLISTHPGFAERSAIANDYATKARGKGCE